MNQISPSNTSPKKPLPWYKHPWVWFVISLPASAVVAGLYTVYVAQQNAPQVIVKQNKFQIEKD
ncbi:FixH family protein [Marinicella meishanensis]|uniref:FixH family protein n=1 Tax=Marinicella meishanensis TaxID=2873263 RepID=UPI001CC01D50|nr:FixH family protein [Marinicella sp. NBU2979]